ncbi:MAG: PEP-CTERM sorting domain-containing protein [Kiritimatiellia bacterium]
MKNVIQLTFIITALTFSGKALSATGIFGGYATFDGTKYKSSSLYGGSEPTFDGADLGEFIIGTDTLILSQGETFTFQNSGHSTFEFAFAYRVRLNSDSKSTNPVDYSFVGMGDGATYVGAGSGDEKAEFTGASIDMLSGITTPLIPTTYAIDIIHKAGAWEGGSNFERLASRNSHNPGDTSWASVDAFTATFSVIPEPSSIVMLALTGVAAGGLALLKRHKRA